MSKSGDGDDITIYEDIEELQELVDKQLKQTRATISQMGKNKDCMFHAIQCVFILHMCIYVQIIDRENRGRKERRKTLPSTLKHRVAV